MHATSIAGSANTARIRTDAKFFRCGDSKWFVKGLSYGPFAPNLAGDRVPERAQVQRDFRQISSLGGNAVRVYYPPPSWLMDEACEAGLRVFVDVPWEKHRCFFEDWNARQHALQTVAQTAQRLGDHPALLAISVVNEIPNDVVRFYGHCRVEQFVGELIDAVKQQSPDCLATFVNFPTTEFLTVPVCDFCCFNVYLHEPLKLAAYLDRLQHVAGNKPLVLGEYGVDSLRQGESVQAELLEAHVDTIAERGLAGTFVFAFTDQWHTGGFDIEDWAFGVTRRDRSEKPAADALRGRWTVSGQPQNKDNGRSAWPKVSVVVCSYNGGSTLRECLDSLMRLEYPDYEVILIDDGSNDETPVIAAEFPQVIYAPQPNRGLSAARNAGAELALGEIVAYTDSDCVADEHWLHYLVQSMQHQQVQAIGGPNITPLGDGWVAKCVAASPGNPSHVMLDDQLAEHIPGCNMAFRRDMLLGLGGFDPQFRQAGDDVDICWRMLDAGMRIGYAPAAVVWHHRRASVRAYLRQQKGYGRSEGMVHFKHPHRCGAFGRASWRGIIYGDGAVGLPLLPETIYHGQFGMAPYQVIYRHNHYGKWACFMSLEWHLLALFLLALSLLFWPLAMASIGMWAATLGLAIRSAARAPLPRPAPRWCRPLVAYLYLIQPMVRGWYRQTFLLRKLRLPRLAPSELKQLRTRLNRISGAEADLYWSSEGGLGREHLLEQLVQIAPATGWRGDFQDAWAEHDLKLMGDCWHEIRLRTATEELGWPRRFTRARIQLRPTPFNRVVTAAALVWILAALLKFQPWAMLLGTIAAASILVMRWRSRRRGIQSSARLLIQAGAAAGLLAADPRGETLPAADGNVNTSGNVGEASIPSDSLDRRDDSGIRKLVPSP